MWFTKPIATELAEVAKVEGSPLQSSYRNTIYCNATLSQEGGKIRGTYCGNRWCLACSRIRTALAIERYMPVISTWGDTWMVTLTRRNVPAAELRPAIAEMLAGFTAAKRAIKRTDGLEFVGLRKLECTYNVRTDEYHPHFHVHVRGQAAARALVRRWLEYFPGATDADAQDCRPVDGDSLRELFKYFTKLVARRKMMPAKALDVIFRSMKGRRVYQPVGFTVTNDDDDESELAPDKGTPATTRPDESISWEWSQDASDWIDSETGECLTGYEPAPKLRELVTTVKRDDLPPVRSIEPEVGATDVDQLRAAMAKRMDKQNRERAPMTPEFVSKQLQKIFALREDHAREVAREITGAETQLDFARELGVKAREFSRRRAFM